MAEELDIVLRVSQLNSAVQQLQSFARDSDVIGESLSKIQLSGQAPATGGGPMARLFQAHDDLAQALQEDVVNRNQVIDSLIGLNKASKSAEKALKDLGGESKTFKERFAETMMSSKYMLGGMGEGFGGRFLPLLGRGLEAAGISPGRLGLGAIFIGLGLAANAAAQSLQKLSDAADRSGATGEQALALTRLGISPEGLAGSAAALRNRLSSDSLSQMFGLQIGLGPTPPRPFGPVNEADLLLTALKNLRDISDEEQRLVIMRQLGLDQYANIMRISDKTWFRVLDSSNMLSDIWDQASKTDFADVATGFDRLGQSLVTLFQVVMKPVAPIVGEVVNTLADLIDTLSKLWDFLINSWLAPASRWLSDLIPNALIGELKLAGNNIGDSATMFKQQMSGRSAAIDAHTKAMMEHAQAMKEGMHGGGPRAQGALPSMLRGMALQRTIEGQAYTFGAFAL